MRALFQAFKKDVFNYSLFFFHFRVCEPVEFLLRPKMLGLGASPRPPEKAKSGGKEGGNAVVSHTFC